MQSIGPVSSSQDLEAAIYFPYDISFVDCDTSGAVRYQIEEHLIRLGHFYERIIDCKVAVRILHKHRANPFFHINVQLDVPGRRLAVSREPEARQQHTEVKYAVRDAFLKMTRQLEDYVKSRNCNKKSRGRLTIPPLETV